jgi:hypothetical protein
MGSGLWLGMFWAEEVEERTGIWTGKGRGVSACELEL